MNLKVDYTTLFRIAPHSFRCSKPETIASKRSKCSVAIHVGFLTAKSRFFSFKKLATNTNSFLRRLPDLVMIFKKNVFKHSGDEAWKEDADQMYE
ncbi:hypothetical protein AVEN_90861-1, partial [Araneus ventricosus]